MFSKHTYICRRSQLVKKMKEDFNESGLLIFPGNIEVCAQGCTSDNGFSFNQDSNLLYYTGINHPGWAVIIDVDSGEVVAYADDGDLDDIIWNGPQPTVSETAELSGIRHSKPSRAWEIDIQEAIRKDRKVHFLPPLRFYNLLRICEACGYSPREAKSSPGENPHSPSVALTKAVISMRLIKEEIEIDALDDACDMGVAMHIAGRNAIRIGRNENEICAAMDEVALRLGWGRSFATILSQRGEILHTHDHNSVVAPGKLLLIDAGVESNEHYASDFTRTYPTSGKFTTRQREVYQIVYECNELAFCLAKPGVAYRDIHLAVARKMLEGLSALDLVRGDLDEMVARGIAGLFQPHGLGHNMGLDVHDMEDLGEDLVGYDPDQTRSKQLGLGSLRMARNLVPGYVITDEPGIYFIPALIEKFKEEGLGFGFVNYAKLEHYYDFGGIRLEDDILITLNGARRLGHNRLPISPDDVDESMRK